VEAYFERTGVETRNGDVVVGYRKPGGRYQVSVALPRDEWEAWSAQQPAGGVAIADVGAPLPAVPDTHTPAAAETTAPPGDILPDIMRSFAIADRSAPVLDRLDILLGTLERWLGFVSTRLDVIDDALLAGDASGERVRVVSETDLRSTESVRHSMETGAHRLIPKASLSTAGADGPAVWDVLGVAPIYADGRVVGALRGYLKAGLDRPTMQRRMELAAAVVRGVIEFNYQFENLTSIDSLTGIYNRQFYDRQMPVEIERAMRSGGSLSMLVLDIDDFKKVNDELGHKKGDEALVAVAEIVGKNLRKVDLAFRYGGEEMVILLPGTPEFEAVHTAERLRRVISQYRGFVNHAGTVRELTVSVGVAVYPDTARSADELFSQADEAMYRAKQRGKNQVVLYSQAEGERVRRAARGRGGGGGVAPVGGDRRWRFSISRDHDWLRRGRAVAGDADAQRNCVGRGCADTRMRVARERDPAPRRRRCDIGGPNRRAARRANAPGRAGDLVSTQRTLRNPLRSARGGGRPHGDAGGARGDVRRVAGRLDRVRRARHAPRRRRVSRRHRQGRVRPHPHA
jgi:diguanylate cyclase (GGDEF)-like protein